MTAARQRVVEATPKGFGYGSIAEITSPVLRARRIDALREMGEQYRRRALQPTDYSDRVNAQELFACAARCLDLVRELEAGKNPPRARRMPVQTDDLDERGELVQGANPSEVATEP